MGFWSAVGTGLSTAATVAGGMLEAHSRSQARMRLVQDFSEGLNNFTMAFTTSMRYDSDMDMFSGSLPYGCTDAFELLSDTAQVMNAWAQAETEEDEAEMAVEARKFIAQLKGVRI
jgi:hypothetical protein